VVCSKPCWMKSILHLITSINMIRLVRFVGQCNVLIPSVAVTLDSSTAMFSYPVLPSRLIPQPQYSHTQCCRHARFLSSSVFIPSVAVTLDSSAGTDCHWVDYRSFTQAVHSELKATRTLVATWYSSSVCCLMLLKLCVSCSVVKWLAKKRTLCCLRLKAFSNITHKIFLYNFVSSLWDSYLLSVVLGGSR
jgi:hypothetical protein